MSSNLKAKFRDLIDKIFALSKDYDNSIFEIQELILKKGDIININNNQDKDDIKFYNSIFDDAIYYIQKSLIIRKKKFNFDFIKFYKYLDESTSEHLCIHMIDKNVFINKFDKYVDQNNLNNYKWIKNDKKKLLYEWIISFEENIKYHIYLYNNIINVLNLNTKFFTEEPEYEIDIYEEVSNFININNSDSNNIDFNS